MIGLALAAWLSWAVWPLRLRSAAVRRRPSMLVVPAVLGSSALHLVSDGAGQGAYVLLVVAVAVASTLERRVSGHGGRHRSPLRSAASAAGALVGWLALRDLTAGAAPGRAIVPAVASGLVLATLVRARRPGGLDVRGAVWSATTYLSVALAVGAARGQEWVPCSDAFDKCTPVGQLYRGPFPSENTLALMAALIATVALALPRSHRRACLLAGLAVLVGLTGSRTSIVALAAVAASTWWLRATAVCVGAQGFRVRRGAAAGLVAVHVAVGLWLVNTAAPGSLSLRGTVWSEARSVVPWTSGWGAGRHRYQAMLDAGSFRGHYPHSQYLLLQFFGGLVAVALFAWLAWSLLAAVRGRSRRSIGLGTAPVAFTLAFGFTELAWNPLGTAPDLWPLVVLFAAIPVELTSTPPAGSQPSTSALVVSST